MRFQNLAILFAAITVACSAPEPTQPDSGGVIKKPAVVPSLRGTVTVGCPNGSVTCEVASNFESRAKGMSGRTSVPVSTGMLFTYSDADVRGFWMKGCLVSLDIAYLRDDGTVVNVGRMDAPAPSVPDDALPRFASMEPVRMVFEVGAGEANRLGVVKGARLRLPPNIAPLLAASDP